VKKSFTIIFGVTIFMLFSLWGCSSNSIRKVEVLDNSIKTNYLVGEEIDIDDFSIKLTYKNNKEEIYNIKEEMVSLSDIDNSIIGNQDMNVYIDYYGMKIELMLKITFDLPQEVTNVINLIDELPSEEDIDFAFEKEINEIERKYSLLNDYYKSYVSNYDEYLVSKEKLNLLKNEFITPEFINKRLILKINLDNLLNSLNENDYSEDEWINILRIYDNSLSKLYLNENYLNIDLIYNIAVNDIKNVRTIEDEEIELLKDVKINTLIEYRKNLLNERYSSNNQIVLDTIVSNFKDSLANVYTIRDIENLYSEYVIELDKIQTLDEEEVSYLNYVKENKIDLVTQILIELNLNAYSDANRVLIVNYYNDCIAKIRLSVSLEKADDEIKIFKYNISKIKTVAEENKDLLKKTVTEAISTIETYSKTINIYEYDTQNRINIENAINSTIEKIENSQNIKEIELMVNELLIYLDEVPTMEEQAIVALPNRIDSAKNELDIILKTLNQDLYSSVNWDKIVNIINNAKLYFEENITIYTSNIVIESEINSIKNEINKFKTIDEENEELLAKIKEDSIKQLDEYYNSLNSNDFNSDVFYLVIDRIEDSKSLVNKLEEVSKIEKLVLDTIEAIENAKLSA